MKKKWFYLAATLLMTGCAEDAFEDMNMQETTERQEIKLFAGTTGLEVESRGAGTVGGLTNDASNVWNGQKLTIWGIKNNAADLTKNNESNVYLKGVTATAPTNATTGVVTLENGPLYYPLQGAFNFTGYYIDDAADGAVSIATNAITQNVEIDGSQDIMIAKAELTIEQKKTLVESLIEYGKLEGDAEDYVDATTADFVTGINAEDKALIEQEYQKAFSSYAARRGVQPEMTFQHQLARLEFSVIAGDENAQGAIAPVTVNGTEYNKGILIKDITIKSAQRKGTITIDNAGNITFAANTTSAPTANDKLILKGKFGTNGNIQLGSDGKLETIEETAPENLYNKDAENTYTRIGESILAFPSDKYTVDITTMQYVQLKKGTTDEYELVEGTTGRNTSYTNVTIQLSGTNTFEAGKTYDIKVKVYSNQEIVITATLQGWEEGEEVVISPEDDLFEQEFNSGTSSGTGTTNP